MSLPINLIASRVAAVSGLLPMARSVRKYIECQYNSGRIPANDNAIASDMARVCSSVGVNVDDSKDVIQDLLRYLVQYKVCISEKAKTPDGGFGLFLSYLKNRARTLRDQKNRARKKNDSLDDMLDDESENSGINEPSTSVDFRVDDKVSVKRFMEVFGKLIPKLKVTLTKEESALFDVVFNDGVGTLSSDIKQNMGQSTVLNTKYPKLFESHQNRFSQYVGELRGRLLDKIDDFVTKKPFS